jgi:hypothetical protein
LGHEAVEAGEVVATKPVSPAFSLRRLFGLHDHVYGAWRSQSATAEGDGKMVVLLSRDCELCSRFEFKRDVVDVPVDGFPYHLNLHARMPEHLE